MKHTFLLASMLLLSCQTIKADQIVTSEQAHLVGDGITMNTQAIQHTIDYLSAQGGGVFVIKMGRYATAPIEMKSNVELRLERGATLLGSTRPDDYNMTTWQGRALKKPDPNLIHALIYADAAHDIRLSGAGTIDGRGCEVANNIDSLHQLGIRRVHYNEVELRPNSRPKLVYFSHCKNVEIAGLTFTNSANWGLSFNQCKNMRLHHLEIINRAYWNNDGIDLTDCHHVEVAYCHVNAADDGLCLKSEDATNACDSIYVHDCAVESSASAIKFGTASYGGFTNIHFARIKVSDTFRSAVAIECVDGGRVENVLMEDIDAFNTGNPIFIRLGNRTGQEGSVSGITVRRMYCEMAFERPDVGYDIRGPIKSTMINPIPSSITGIPGHPVKDIIIENVMLVYPGNASKGMHYIPTWNVDRVPEQIDHYPEFDMFGELPSYAFFVRHADNIIFRNINIKLKHDDFRPAFVLDDAHNVEFEHIIYPLGKGACQIFDTKKQEDGE